MTTRQWTQTELNTLLQNLHLTPSGIRSVIPGRTLKGISDKKRRVMKRGAYNPSQGKAIMQSLKKRNWNIVEISHYMQAIRGDNASQQRLYNAGLWNIKATGVMS